MCPIFNDKAELPRHSASLEYPPPAGHSLVIALSLWQKGPRQTKDDVTMGGTSSESRGNPNENATKITDVRLHNAVLKTLCVLSQQAQEIRGAIFICWMIKQEAPEYKKPKEQLRAYSEQAASKGKGHALGPPGLAAFTGLLQALSERCSAVGPTNAAAVANFKQKWDDLEPEGAFDMVPHGKLAKVHDPALCRLELVISVAAHRQHVRSALGQTGANRLLGQAPSGGLERAQSSALEQTS